MNIENNGGSVAVAETQMTKRPHFRDDGVFVGTLRDAYCVKPTREEIINVLESSIRSWGDVEACSDMGVWHIKCHYEAIRLIEGMKEEA